MAMSDAELEALAEQISKSSKACVVYRGTDGEIKIARKDRGTYDKALLFPARVIGVYGSKPPVLWVLEDLIAAEGGCSRM